MPDPGASLAVIDESTPAYSPGKVVYSMALAIVLPEDVVAVRSRLIASLRRRRPLHWESEGAVVRQRVIREVCDLPIVVHVASLIVAGNAQPSARSDLLHERLLPLAGQAGAGRLVIERRSKAEDNRDRQEIRTWFRNSDYRLTGIEHVAKDEPLTWVSDALAGVWSDVVLGRGEGHLDALFASGALQSSWQGWQ